MIQANKNILPAIRIQDSWLLRDSIADYCTSRSGGKDAQLTDNALVEMAVDTYTKAWKPLEQEILDGMCKTVGLSFIQNIIDVYIVPGFIPFSDPMVIGAKREPDNFVDTLTHELLHRLLTDNTVISSKKELLPAWKKLFGDEHSIMTLAHIPVHAIHKAIYLDVLHAPERLERDITDVRNRNAIDYSKSWEYVDEYGYKEIISKLKESYQKLGMNNQ